MFINIINKKIYFQIFINFKNFSFNPGKTTRDTRLTLMRVTHFNSLLTSKHQKSHSVISQLQNTLHVFPANQPLLS